jgi:hypothetical protein
MGESGTTAGSPRDESGISAGNARENASKKCARCGRTDPEVSFQHRILRRRYPGDVEPRVVILIPSFCEECVRQRQSDSRVKLYQERRVAESKEKVCTGCRKSLPRTRVYFAPHSKAKDGTQLLTSKCRECLSMRVTNYRRVNPKYREWRLAYSQRPEVVERMKKHSKVRKRKLPTPSERLVQRQRNKLAAWVKVGWVIVPCLCEVCGASRKLRADYPYGYDDPIRVSFACYPCTRWLWKVRRDPVEPQDDREEFQQMRWLAASEKAAIGRAISARIRRAAMKRDRLLTFKKLPRKKRVAKANFVYLRERRAIYLTQVCEFTRGQTKEMMEAEGWSFPPPTWLAPLDLVLGMWLPRLPAPPVGSSGTPE